MVRMRNTGRQNPELGCEFGLPYVYVRAPRNYDQTTLNYAWQLCGTQAYSLYAGKTREIDEAAADRRSAPSSASSTAAASSKAKPLPVIPRPSSPTRT